MLNLGKIHWSGVRARRRPPQPNRTTQTMQLIDLVARATMASAEVMIYGQNTQPPMIEVALTVALINMTRNLVRWRTVFTFLHSSLFYYFFFVVADEFSSQDEDDKDSIQMPNPRDANGIPKIISRCKAIYSYTPKLSDELRINPGMNPR